MRKFSLYIMVFSLINFSSAIAETGKAGQTGDFLKFGLGARALGMGGAYGSIAEGVDAIYYNPAGAAFMRTKQVGFTYHSLTLDRYLNSAALLLPARNEAVLGVSWINSFVGDVPMRDSDRNLYSDFANSQNLFCLTFAKIFGEGFAGAGNLKYIHSKLDDLTSYTVGADLGIIYKFQKMYAAGLSIADLGARHKWDSSDYWSRGNAYDDAFPMRIRGGVSGAFLDEALVTSVDVVAVEDILFKIHGGAEYWLFQKMNVLEPDEEAEDEMVEKVVNKRFMGLRAGYSDGSFTAGFSLYYPYGNVNGGMDYAFMTGKRSEGSYHIITVRIMF
jgi:hypothetical protein